MGVSSSFISVAERLREAVWRASAAVALMGLFVAGGAVAAQAQPETADVVAYLESDQALNSELLQGFFGEAITGFGVPHVIHTFRGGFFGRGGTTPDPVAAGAEFLAVAFSDDAAVGVVRIGEDDGEVAMVEVSDAAELASALATRELVSADSPLVLVEDPQGEGWLVLEEEFLSTLSPTPQTYTLAEYSEREAGNGGTSGLGPFSILLDPRVFWSVVALLVAAAVWLVAKRRDPQKARLRS